MGGADRPPAAADPRRSAVPRASGFRRSTRGIAHGRGKPSFRDLTRTDVRRDPSRSANQRGHRNEYGETERADTIGASEVNAGHLRAFIERIERLEEEKKALAGDIKDVYGEAKANGFDVKIMRKIVSIRKQDRDSRIEEETVLDLYLAALGMN